jgi:predicted peroxiredoxin
MARLLYLVHHSTDEPERVLAAVEAARGAQASGHEVGLWLAHEGVRLAVTAVAETIRRPRPAAPVLDALVQAGAALHASEPCFEQRAFEHDVLRPGAALAGPGDLGGLVDEGWVPVAT